MIRHILRPKVVAVCGVEGEPDSVAVLFRGRSLYWYISRKHYERLVATGAIR